MKFEDYKYLKHEYCMDAFIAVQSVIMDTGEVALIWASWMTQGQDGFWSATMPVRFKVNKENYDKWKEYTPKGDYKL